MTSQANARRPRVGLDAYSLVGPSGREICENDIFALLRVVKNLGGDGLQASLPDDPGRTAAAFDLADDLGLYLEPYVRLPLHWRDDQEEIRRREREFHRICRAASERGVRALHCTMGARERFEDVHRWKVFVDATAECLRRLAPALREYGVRIGIENHWDYSTYEILGIVERAGADVVGVGLDTGNLPILAEAPDRAMERALPYTVTTHLKDVMLFSTSEGRPGRSCRSARGKSISRQPCGGFTGATPRCTSPSRIIPSSIPSTTLKHGGWRPCRKLPATISLPWPVWLAREIVGWPTVASPIPMLPS
jgi:sugar phosphate isomerase/epimerase